MKLLMVLPPSYFISLARLSRFNLIYFLHTGLLGNYVF
jgi:hypothetical protein